MMQVLSRVQARALGSRARGPKLNDLAGNYLFAKQFFRGGTTTYNDFKQQCMSLRIFAMGGLVLYYSVCLIKDPPRSSYWKNWSIFRLPGNIFGQLSANGNEIFLEKPREAQEGQIPIMDAYAQLTLKRRLDSDVAED